MISINELSSCLTHAESGHRHILLFTFYCDESYDSPKEKLPSGSPPFEPHTYVVGGFFSEEKIWTRVERRWKKANERYNVPRYHASHLNAKTYEYDGWCDSQKIRYSKQMLRIIQDQGQYLHAVSFGMLADEYRNIISEEGRRRFGIPYLACFKTCLIMIGKEMGAFPEGDQFSVILDRNPLEAEATKLFYGLKDDPGFRYRSRFATCAPASSDEVPALQTADLIAYESFRLLQNKRNGNEEIRKVMKSLFPTSGFLGYYLESKTLKAIKEPLESATCEENKWVLVLPSAKENTRYMNERGTT